MFAVHLKCGDPVCNISVTVNGSFSLITLAAVSVRSNAVILFLIFL